jgi:hypothetical protein
MHRLKSQQAIKRVNVCCSINVGEWKLDKVVVVDHRSGEGALTHSCQLSDRRRKGDGTTGNVGHVSVKE